MQAFVSQTRYPDFEALAKDLPAGLPQAAITQVTADEQKVISLANQVIQDGKAADAFAALAAAKKKAGQPAPTVPNPSPVATLVADTAKLNQAEQTLTTDLKTYKATCFYGAACFAAGTPLRTPDGSKAIEEIRVGDSILSRSEYDPSGPVEPRVVEEVFVRIGSIWRLQVGGRSIESSGEHPFYSWEKGWVACNELKVGDLLLTESGAWSVAETVEDTGNWATLYNLRVADFHTYFVGGDGCAVWAHNAVCSLPGADPSSRSEGIQLAELAKDIYVSQVSVKNIATLRVTEVQIDGAERVVLSLNNIATPSDKLKIENYAHSHGEVYVQATAHPDTYLYDLYHGKTGFLAIGISNYTGPCQACKAYFLNTVHFYNVYWDSTFRT